jgi:hypothetical protein
MKRSTRFMRSTYSIKLELLLDFRIRVKRINLFELKLNSSITLILVLISILTTLNLMILLNLIRDL